MDDDNQVISVSDKNGDNILKIEGNNGKITVKAKTKAIVEAPQIELVENSTHPVVFGDELMTYLGQLVTAYQSHIHPGQSATPVPPLPTPTPSLISTKVKAG